MLENLLSLLKSDSASWLNFNSTAWVMDMILAFACGLCIFLLLFPFLPDYLLVPPPLGRKKHLRKYHMVKKGWSKIGKKSYTRKARRDCWEEGKGIDDLASFLQSHIGDLLHSSRLYQLLREDAPDDEEFQSVSARADTPIRQPSEDCFVTASSSSASPAPSTEHLPPVAPTLSPGVETFPVSLGSQPASSASLPPEPLTPPRCLSPQPLLLSTSPSRTPSPMASWPPLPDPSLALPQWDSSPLPLGTIPQNLCPPNNCSLSSPAPAISILDHSGCPISALSHGQEPPRALCHSSLSDSECQGGHLTCQSPAASVLPDIAHTQVENGSSYFLNPDVQKVLEILINKKVERKICKNTKEEGRNIPLYSVGNKLKSLDKEQDPITSQAFWKTKGKADRLPVSQQLFYPKVLGDQLQQKCSQLFWGLPILHSESLMDNIRASGASLEISPILFNGLCNYVPVQIQTNVRTQLFSPQPLVHHVAQPQTSTLTMPSCKTPPVSQKQTQEHVPSLPVVPGSSPPVRAWDVSCPTNKKGRQYPISPTVQYLQHKLLKEQKENKRVLPSVVKKSQKVVSQSTDKYQASQENKSSVNFPVDVIQSKLREELEQHLKKKYMRELPQKIHLSLDLTELREKYPGTSQAKENFEPPQTSVFSDKSSQVIQKIRPGCPEILQEEKYSSDNLAKVLKSLSGSPENSPVNDLELRSPRSDSGNDSARGPDQKHLDDSIKVHSSGKAEQTADKIPLGVDYSTLTVDHACDPPGNSNTPIETGNKPFLKDQENSKNIQDFSLLDPDTQQVLEAHIKRFWVRHRWGLTLRVIKAVCIFKLKKAHALFLPQPASSSSASSNSMADSTSQNIKFLGETCRKIPGEKVKAIISVLKMQGPLNGPSLKSPTVNLSGDNCGSSEAPPTGQEASLISQPHTYSIVGRTWHRDTVPGPGIGTFGPSSSPKIDRYKPQDSGVVGSGDPFHSVSTKEMNIGCLHLRAGDIKETVKTEKKQPSDWALTKGASVMSTSQNLNVSLKSLKSLGSNKSFPTSRISTLQDPGDSCLGTQAKSENQTQDPATGVLLQDFATGRVLQDSASEMHLTEDILASQTHLFRTQGVSDRSISPSRGICDFQARNRKIEEQKEPRISKPQYPPKSKSNMFGPQESGECFESPRRMITNSPSSSRGICNLLTKERMSQEQKELRMAKPQDPRMSESKMFVSMEGKKSFERPKTGGKEGRFVGGRGIGEVISSSQLREIRDTMGSKSLLLSEKKQASSESTFGNRVRNFLQHILPDKGRGEAESLQKVKPPSTTTQSQGSVTSSKLSMDSGSIEAQVLVTTIGRILEEKMKQQHELSASKENVPKGKPQIDRWSSYGKNASLPQQRRIMSNMAGSQRVSPKGSSYLMNSTLNTDRESNPAFPPRETQPLTNHFHRRPMGTGTSDHPVHCPRHCTLQKRVSLSQSQNASCIYPSLLTKPDLFH